MVFVLVVVVMGVVLEVAMTFLVCVVGLIDRQLQALDKVGPEGYFLSADGSFFVAAAALLSLVFAGGHVLELSVDVPSVTISVTVVVLRHCQLGCRHSIVIMFSAYPPFPLVFVLIIC